MEIPESFRNSPYAQQHFIRIVEWAKEHHPFYKARFSDNVTSVPILTREEVLDNNHLLLNGREPTGRTSGSTGVPVKICWSDERRKIEQVVTNKFVGWLGGTRPVTKIIHTGDDQPSDQYLDVNVPVAEQLEVLCQRYRDHGAVALTTYPTNAERLCRAVIEGGLDMRFIERFGCYAEVFEEHQEALISQAFPNAEIWSTYSSTEFGMIAARCPHKPQYHHVFSGKLGVEVLNEQGLPCADDEIGRVVITDFFNTHAPFIRYEIGDLAAKGHCPCGKIDLPALSKVIGKVRGALVHRSGERVPFTDLSVALRDIDGMRQYQVIQHELDDIELRFVTRLDDAGVVGLISQAQQVITEHFGYSPRLTFTRESIIERGANGKFYASISHV